MYFNTASFIILRYAYYSIHYYNVVKQRKNTNFTSYILEEFILKSECILQLRVQAEVNMN
jgi:hypothetical protein